ncbi:MAG: hypothetical protein H6R04_1578 [Burkholderiaceae bacterium]|nr:hypothetical protein [Burkholderiaceae bacterium]
MVAERFLQVFLDHGIETVQIPRLLGAVTHTDLQSPAHLLKVITPAVLDQVATLFNIRSAYLEGVDDRIYEYLATYKRPTSLLDCLREFWNKSQWKNAVNAPLRILATTSRLNCHEGFEHLLVPVLVEPIAILDEEPICRYHVYQDGFNWDYAPTRIELKAIARTIHCAFGGAIPLYEVEPQEMAALLEGRLIPHALLKRPLITDPSFEDYILEPEKSVVAKESDELPAVFEYMQKTGLDTYDFQIEAHVEPTTAASEDETAPEAPLPEKQPKKQASTGKRQIPEARWRDVRSPHIGGSKSRHSTDDRYSKALGLLTSTKLRSSTTS